MPGDRPDKSIVQAAQVVAGNYDLYFLKEDWNLRGRKRGDVINLLRTTLLQEGVSERQIHSFASDQSELDAVTAVYEWMDVGDIVMLQADDINRVRQHLLGHLGKLAPGKSQLPPVSGSGEPQGEYNYARFAETISRQDENSD
jgi:cyanophycin synthetase